MNFARSGQIGLRLCHCFHAVVEALPEDHPASRQQWRPANRYLTTLSLIRSILSYSPSIFLPRLGGIVLVALLTRTMPTERYGTLLLILASAEVLDRICLDWVRVALARFGGGRPETLSVYTSICARLYIRALIGSLLFACVVAASLGRTERLTFAVCLIAHLAAMASTRFASTLLASRGCRDAYMKVEVGSSAAMLFLALGAAWWQPDSVLAISLAASLGMLAIGLWGLGRSVADLRVDLRTAEDDLSGAILAYALPIVPSSILAASISWMDRFVLDVVAGPAVLALYGASVTLARRPMETMFGLVNKRVFSQLMQDFDRDGRAAAGRSLADLVAGMAFLTLPAAIGLILVAEPLATLLLAPQYVGTAVEILPLIVAATMLSGLQDIVFNQVLHMDKRSIAMTLLQLPAAAAGLLSLLILAAPFGPWGCALSVIIQMAVYLLVSLAATWRRFTIPLPFADLGRIFLAGLIMAAVLVWLRSEIAPLAAALRLSILAIAGTLTYGACMLVMRPKPVRDLFKRTN